MKFVKYDHHDGEVSVREDLKGKHREYCLCWNCSLFHSNESTNCKIAKALFALDKEFNLVTPVWECPKFDEFIWPKKDV